MKTAIKWVALVGAAIAAILGAVKWRDKLRAEARKHEIEKEAMEAANEADEIIAKHERQRGADGSGSSKRDRTWFSRGRRIK
jgi:hypothetical protein